MGEASREAPLRHIGDAAETYPDVPLGGPRHRPPGLVPPSAWVRRPHADLPALRRLRAHRPGPRPQTAWQAARRVHPGAAWTGPHGLRLAPPPCGADVARLRRGAGALRVHHVRGVVRARLRRHVRCDDPGGPPGGGGGRRTLPAGPGRGRQPAAVARRRGLPPEPPVGPGAQGSRPLRSALPRCPRRPGVRLAGAPSGVRPSSVARIDGRLLSWVAFVALVAVAVGTAGWGSTPT